MTTPVSENEPISQTEDDVNFSFNASESELQRKQPRESEAPLYNTDETTVEEDPVYDNVAQTTGEEPAENSIATSVSEGPVSNDVVATDGEAPVSNSNDSQLAQENLVDNCEDDMSIVKVDEGSFNNSVAVMEEGSFNNSVAVMEEGSFVSNNIVPAMEEGLSVSNGILPVMEDGSSVSNSIIPVTGEGSVSNSLGPVRVPPEKRTLYKFGQRTSNYRGVTRHRWTGKYEAHLWDNSTITEGRKRKGKQVYLGGYESEEKAAQAYDLAALKYWGPGANTKLNFPISTYEKELEEMKDMSREEYVNSLRRKSICFTRGHSIYRGVTRQNEGRRWQARIGRVAGGKDIYLGTYDTEEEAAEAYDIAAVKLRGMNAITNFDISNYYKEGTKELDVIPIKTVEEESSHLKIRYFKLT